MISRRDLVPEIDSIVVRQGAGHQDAPIRTQVPQDLLGELSARAFCSPELLFEFRFYCVGLGEQKVRKLSLFLLVISVRGACHVK